MKRSNILSGLLLLALSPAAGAAATAHAVDEPARLNTLFDGSAPGRGSAAAVFDPRGRKTALYQLNAAAPAERTAQAAPPPAKTSPAPGLKKASLGSFIAKAVDEKVRRFKESSFGKAAMGAVFVAGVVAGGIVFNGDLTAGAVLGLFGIGVVMGLAAAVGLAVGTWRWLRA